MTKKTIIKKVIESGAEIRVNTFSRHQDKDLGKLMIVYNKWTFNAWFNTRLNTFRTPCYYFGYKGILGEMDIKTGLKEMIKLTKTNDMSVLKPW